MRFWPRRALLVALTGAVWLAIALIARGAAGGELPRVIEFNRDVRAILSDACFQCHGPDSAKRKASLRLDTEAGAFAPREKTSTLIPGKPEQSELYRRITTTNAEDHMPPAASGRQLAAREIELLRRWIEQGAKWERHWAFLAPRREAIPVISNQYLVISNQLAGVRGPATAPPLITPSLITNYFSTNYSSHFLRSANPVDSFILARLAREGLAPSPEAEKTALIRRVTLDLTGLPPTLAEVDAFLADTSPRAYETVVERLLASPRYGERMAIRWLEAARYADTSGYQSDGERTMWRWRDWVIDAFNRNLPFDQFTIEQLAGDLLPGATLSQRIATGFNRNHRGNAEGGIVPAEYAVEYVVDRVDTTATVWLGLTAGCARCHDHKYDPLTQREFYQLFAFFNNVPEKGRAVKTGNSPPFVVSPTDAQVAELAALDTKLAAATRGFGEMQPEVHSRQIAWEKSLAAEQPLDWTLADGLQARFKLNGTLANAAGTNAAATFEAGASAFAPGRRGGATAAEFDGVRFVNCGEVGNFGFFDKFTLAAWIQPRGTNGGAILSRMVEQDADSGFASDSEGYSVHLKGGRVQVYLTKRWLDDALRVETEAALAPDAWQHVTVVYDGSRLAAGVKIFVNGQPQKTRVLLDQLNQTFATKQPLRVGAGGGPKNRFHGLIGDVRVYGRALTAEEAGVVAVAENLTELAALPASQRTTQHVAKLRTAFLEQHAPAPLRGAHRELISLQRQRAALVESFPTTMVMEEMPQPRDTFILKRGEYDKPAEKVGPGFPAALLAKSGGAPKNRLDFARWLVAPENPLTARVAVNHYWQTFFGAGLVRTVEDFGAQGLPPTHPELLDWLATEFLRSGWDVKAMHKLLVMSATYRQSSRVTPELLARDPDNVLLARAPRPRLSAEMVRDQALLVSGLLVENIGGPSVMPYQPAGLWKELSGTDHVPEHGEKLWRRSLYTYWKRTSPPPMMSTFDAPGREMACVRQTRTCTPLQALALMNDVTFVEAARKLAERMISHGGSGAGERIRFAFRLATAREPRAGELKLLTANLERQQARFRTDAAAALALVSAGESPRDERVPTGELAAYTAVANLILNLDETITRP